MAINSAVYLLFLATVAVLYYVLPRRFQNVILLAANYVFYCINAWQYAALIIATTALSYAVARWTAKTDDQKRRRLLSALCIVILLAVLAFFKYVVPLVLGGMAEKGVQAGWFQKLVLPLGISYYTLQIIGYLIDVKNGKVEPETGFVRYALFVSFFPQLVSGPIGRSSELMPQYREAREFRYGNLLEGCQRFLTGAFKKIVIADGLGVIVSGVYDDLESYTGAMLLVAIFLFATQIYADASGYADMAVGAAKILGITLRENYKAPYFATSVTGFWQRWHMSLTSWLADYVFTPLVWSRWYNKLFFGKKADEHKPAVVPNILIVFLLSGIWHGGTVNYVIWGLAHGLLRAGEELLLRARKKRGLSKKRDPNRINTAIKRTGVYIMSVVTLVFFHAKTLQDALYIFKNLFIFAPFATTKEQFLYLASNGIMHTSTYYSIYFGGLIAGLIILFLLDRRVHAKSSGNNALATFGKTARWLLYWAMGLLVMVFYLIALSGLLGSPSFIYGGF